MKLIFKKNKMKIKNDHPKFKLKEGHSVPCLANKPSIFITGTGRNTYLWIGNNSDDSGWCFATMSGRKTLRKLARKILTVTK